MNMRNNWTLQEEKTVDLFYSKEETIANVKENFDIRRFYSCEGYNIKINGISERCIVQTSSNPLRELNDFRKIHCPINADVKRGYYVEYENSIWLIDTNVVNVDGAYYSTRMSRCQYILRWQGKNGEIIERWGYASDQTKYSSGEKGNSAITVGDNQYGLLVPIDSETKQLKRNMRFSFDFDDAEEPDIYNLTNRKIVLSEGTMLLSFTFGSFDKNKDRHVTLENGSQVWICDYRSPTPSPDPLTPDETTDLSAMISGGKMLRCGRAKSWTAIVKDKSGNEIADCYYEWSITSDFNISSTEQDNKIQLKIDDDSLIGESFLLSVTVNSSVSVNCEILITEGL